MPKHLEKIMRLYINNGKKARPGFKRETVQNWLPYEIYNETSPYSNDHFSYPIKLCGETDRRIRFKDSKKSFIVIFLTELKSTLRTSSGFNSEKKIIKF